MITNEPIFFERNRVGRVYTGGKLFADFFGDEPVDGFLPEEWIASNVTALNKDSKGPKEGVSKVKDSDVYFDDLLKEYPIELLGSKGKLRILVKGLDSSIRLPAQAHPDKPFSRKYFNSEYGKTECWTILGTRPGAKIYFGFKDGVTKEIFENAIEQSETDKDAMENLMLSLTPQVGDVYLVPAKTVHAIGAGCLILEVQEPTDFTIQPERWCGDYKMNDQEMYLGLTKEEAVGCFNFTKAPDSKMVPKVIETGDNMVKEALVSEENTDCFIVNRVKLSCGSFVPDVNDSYAIYIVTDGTGSVTGDNYKKDLKKGDYFFMPASAMGKFTIQGQLEIVECF
ncbi:MAG: class I mannose-6-phosphate isomerase [Clostridia bacterium]|nr:class I mannose-6-phosphate isomerase [Clostridia bacterium]